MATLTKTWTFNSDLEGWTTSGTTNRITTDGSPDLGCLYITAVGRNTTVTPTVSWTGTYESLGIPSGSTITGLQGSLYFKQNITGSVADAYWDLWYDSTNSLVTSPNDFTSIAWGLRTGTAVTGLSLASTANLALTLDGYMRCANDKTAVIDMYWDTISVEITYDAAFITPTVASSAATSIGFYTATLNGDLSALGDATTVDRFFEWREVGAGTWNTTTKNAQTSTGTFNQAISGLSHSTNYEFRAVAEYTDGGTQAVYGSTLSFSTTTYTAPSITTVAASNITTDRAALNGDLTSLGSATTVNRFFEWREVGSPTWNTTSPTAQSTSGTFSSLTPVLSSSTNYEFRAVATYNDGTEQTITGTTLTFSTLTISYTLSVSVDGNGSVELDSTPLTLPYSESLIEGMKSLEAIPDIYNSFTKWTVGGVDDFTNPLSLNLDANKTVIAYFSGENNYILEKYIVDTWTVIATVSLETTSYKDTSTFVASTSYDYRLLKIENGVSVTPPTLSASLVLTDAPATIQLNWGGGT